MANILDYFSKLNTTGQILFIIGIILVLIFIVLVIMIFKPEKKAKKVYSENELTDKEDEFEKKLKDIDNISDNDINIDNEKTRNLKGIVDKLKGFNNNNLEEKIEAYEKDEEATAVISLDELIKYNKPIKYEKRNVKVKEEDLFEDDIEEIPTFKKQETRETREKDYKESRESRSVRKEVEEELLFDDEEDDLLFEDVSETKQSETKPKEVSRSSRYNDDEIFDVSNKVSRAYENTYKPKREVFSSVYSPDDDK